MSRTIIVRDGAEIYRRSFATIVLRPDLAPLRPRREQVAVRMIHACGMVEIAGDLVFSETGPWPSAESVMARSRRSYVIRKCLHVASSRHGCRTQRVICTLEDPGVPSLAQKARNDAQRCRARTWRDRLDGAVVAIGNAQPLCFIFSTCSMKPPPACLVLGMPVGFVGAGESKDALIAARPRVFHCHQRAQGGSAMAAAALNAIAERNPNDRIFLELRAYTASASPAIPTS